MGTNAMKSPENVYNLTVLGEWTICGRFSLFLPANFLNLSALTLLFGRQEEHPAYKKCYLVVCLERRGNDCIFDQVMQLPTHYLLITIQNGLTFLVPA